MIKKPHAETQLGTCGHTRLNAVCSYATVRIASSLNLLWVRASNTFTCLAFGSLRQRCKPLWSEHSICTPAALQRVACGFGDLHCKLSSNTHRQDKLWGQQSFNTPSSHAWQASCREVANVTAIWACFDPSGWWNVRCGLVQANAPVRSQRCTPSIPLAFW